MFPLHYNKEYLKFLESTIEENVIQINNYSFKNIDAVKLLKNEMTDKTELSNGKILLSLSVSDLISHIKLPELKSIFLDIEDFYEFYIVKLHLTAQNEKAKKEFDKWITKEPKNNLITMSILYKNLFNDKKKLSNAW